MADNLLKRAKAFMGLEEEEEERSLGGKPSQMEITSVLKSKRDLRDSSLYEIVIYEPKVYEDSLGIAASLRSGAPVLVNLKHLESQEGTRLIDFVCGTAYAIDGHMIKIGDTIFLFTPSSIRVVDAEERSSLSDDMSGFDDKKDTFFNRR